MFITVGIEIQHTGLCKEKQIKENPQNINVLVANMLVLENPLNMEAALGELKTALVSLII